MGFGFERVDAHDYKELRAGYAPEAISWIAMRCGIGPGSTVVDVGAGSGQLAIPLSELGAEVWGRSTPQ